MQSTLYQSSQGREFKSQKSSHKADPFCHFLYSTLVENRTWKCNYVYFFNLSSHSRKYSECVTLLHEVLSINEYDNIFRLTLNLRANYYHRICYKGILAKSFNYFTIQEFSKIQKSYIHESKIWLMKNHTISIHTR